MAPSLVHLHGRALVEPEQAEGDEEDMKDAGVIRVLVVLKHEFPVARDALPQVAQHFKLATVEHPVEIAEHLWPEKIFERRNGKAKPSEDKPVADYDPYGLGRVFLLVQLRVHAP